MIDFNKVTMNLSFFFFLIKKKVNMDTKKNYTHNLILVLSFLPFFDKKKKNGKSGERL
jgi:hypothetical protein